MTMTKDFPCRSTEVLYRLAVWPAPVVGCDKGSGPPWYCKLWPARRRGAHDAIRRHGVENAMSGYRMPQITGAAEWAVAAWPAWRISCNITGASRRSQHDAKSRAPHWYMSVAVFTESMARQTFWGDYKEWRNERF